MIFHLSLSKPFSKCEMRMLLEVTNAISKVITNMTLCHHFIKGHVQPYSEYAIVQTENQVIIFNMS